MDPIVNKSEVGGGNKNNANVNSEQLSVHPSSGRRSPTSSPASQRQKQSRGGQKQAQRGAAKSRRSSDSNNEDEKSSSGSSSYLQSNEGLQDQMTALFTDVQTMFNDVQVSLGARDEVIAGLRESSVSMQSALESLAHSVRVISMGLNNKPASGGVSQNVLSGGDALVDSHDEFIVPALSSQAQQGPIDRTVLDGSVDMSDLMRMGSHEKSRFNSVENF